MASQYRGGKALLALGHGEQGPNNVPTAGIQYSSRKGP